MSELDLPATRAQIPAVQIFNGGLLAEESYRIPVSVVVTTGKLGYLPITGLGCLRVKWCPHWFNNDNIAEI